MGRVAFVVLLSMLVTYVWFFQQPGSPDRSTNSQKANDSKYHKKHFTTATANQVAGTKRPQRRMLLQLRLEEENEELRRQMMDQNPENLIVDEDSPVHVQLPIPTGDLNQPATKNKLIVKLPPNSNCSSPLNSLCQTEEDTGCSNQTRCNITSVLIMGGLQAHTVYVLKKQNITINNCDLETNNCSVGLPKEYRPAAIDRGLEPGPLDVMWSPQEERCKREAFYLFKLTAEDNPELKDIHKRQTHHCHSLMCVHASNEKDGSKFYDVQMQVMPVDQLHRLPILHEDEMEMCAKLRMHGKEELGSKNMPATPLFINTAWMNAMWVAVGATAGLAFLTIIAICFQKRSVPVQGEVVHEEVLDIPLPPEVPIVAQMEALGLDMEPLLENEIFPPSLSPDNLTPVSRPRTPSFTLHF